MPINYINQKIIPKGFTTTMMTTRDFCYWLQGFFELNSPTTLSEEQVELIKKHLYVVFKHDCEQINSIIEQAKLIKSTKETNNEVWSEVIKTNGWNKNTFPSVLSFPNPPASC